MPYTLLIVFLCAKSPPIGSGNININAFAGTSLTLMLTIALFSSKDQAVIKAAEVSTVAKVLKQAGHLCLGRKAPLRK